MSDIDLCVFRSLHRDLAFRGYLQGICTIKVLSFIVHIYEALAAFPSHFTSFSRAMSGEGDLCLVFACLII